MDFTLTQLSNENLALLFNNAFYQAEVLTSKNENGEEESVATIVRLNDWTHVVYANAKNHYLSFETRLSGNDMEMDQMLKICNANAYTDDDGEVIINFIYKHIVPEGTSICDRFLIGVFRSFAQMFENHYEALQHVRENVA